MDKHATVEGKESQTTTENETVDIPILAATFTLWYNSRIFYYDSVILVWSFLLKTGTK